MDTINWIIYVIAGMTSISAFSISIFFLLQYLRKKKLNSNHVKKKIYKEFINKNLQYLDFTGLYMILRYPVRLGMLYSPLKIKETGQDVDLFIESYYTHLSNQNRPSVLIILGTPGSGKTTLLKWIALQCSQSHNAFYSLRIPLYLPLSRLQRNNPALQNNIMDLASLELKQQNIDPGFLDINFKKGKLLFLLDGLDEVGDEKNRRDTMKWLQNQDIGKNGMIITSRLGSIREDRGIVFPGAKEITLQELNLHEVESFLDRFFHQLYSPFPVTNDNPPDHEKSIHQLSIELIHIIKDNRQKGLAEIALNPLLLTIIAIVHSTRAILPIERHKLYEECLKVMIELWNVANRKVPISFSLETSLKLLSLIAFHLMKNNLKELERKDMDAFLPPTVEDKPLDDFLDEMLLKAGVLFESQGKFRFLYLFSLQYLTAYYFATNKNQNTILQYRFDENWKEIFLLFVNMGSARDFFAEITQNLFDFRQSYWLNISLWVDCLDALVNESQKESYQAILVKDILDFMTIEQKQYWKESPHQDILAYFSSLNNNELWEFQMNNPDYIARELHKGNYPVLQSDSILEETLEKVVKQVSFDRNTIERLLDFPIDFDNPSANHIFFKAFVILKRADYAKLREILVEIITENYGKQIWLNALYIFKRIN